MLTPKYYRLFALLLAGTLGLAACGGQPSGPVPTVAPTIAPTTSATSAPTSAPAPQPTVVAAAPTSAPPNATASPRSSFQPFLASSRESGSGSRLIAGVRVIVPDRCALRRAVAGHSLQRRTGGGPPGPEPNEPD